MTRGFTVAPFNSAYPKYKGCIRKKSASLPLAISLTFMSCCQRVALKFGFHGFLVCLLLFPNLLFDTDISLMFCTILSSPAVTPSSCSLQLQLVQYVGGGLEVPSLHEEGYPVLLEEVAAWEQQPSHGDGAEGLPLETPRCEMG